jgi:hypothetical protein
MERFKYILAWGIAVVMLQATRFTVYAAGDIIQAVQSSTVPWWVYGIIVICILIIVAKVAWKALKIIAPIVIAAALTVWAFDRFLL